MCLLGLAAAEWCDLYFSVPAKIGPCQMDGMLDLSSDGVGSGFDEINLIMNRRCQYAKTRRNRA